MLGAQPVGAIDCGTNSFRLLVASRGAEGELVEHTRRLRIVRLGQGVDASGRLHPDALERTFAAAEEYAEALAAYGVEPQRRRVVATSAARDARNVEDFFAGMQARLGVRPEVVSGEEEARLSFVGAVSGLGSGSGVGSDAAASIGDRGSMLVMDIGGGSTELVLGHRSGRIERSVSLDIGSVRLTERFGLIGPWTSAVRAEAEAYVDGLLDGLGWPLAAVGGWIGVAGTVTTMSALAQGLTAYDRSLVHGSTLAVADVTILADRLTALTSGEIGALGVPPGRADVIAAGALIADRLARRVGRPMRVSETDILDGIALGLLTP